ncbi:hypothetical protein WA026_012347 [Henosepilachna vigintioctopunctata]|uniref:Uncharacterized protein n=1 Tax=Henosepilachna vigintioctopunctata TaxID=420089 RepID=A0AAW1UR01_9CUCU
MHDSFNFHRKFNEITSCYNKRNVSSIRHNNKMITDNEQLRLTWENYIKDLYQNVRPAAKNLTQQEDITGPPILVSEVKYAIANLKDEKTPGEGMVQAEVLMSII